MTAHDYLFIYFLFSMLFDKAKRVHDLFQIKTLGNEQFVKTFRRIRHRPLGLLIEMAYVCYVLLCFSHVVSLVRWGT